MAAVNRQLGPNVFVDILTWRQDGAHLGRLQIRFLRRERNEFAAQKGPKTYAYVLTGLQS